MIGAASEPSRAYRSCGEMEYLRSSMRKSPRQVECCAVLGPESQGETAFSPSRLIIRPGRKCNRNRNANGQKTIEGNITNSCGSDWAPSAMKFVVSTSELHNRDNSGGSALRQKFFLKINQDALAIRHGGRP